MTTFQIKLCDICWLASLLIALLLASLATHWLLYHAVWELHAFHGFSPTTLSVNYISFPFFNLFFILWNLSSLTLFKFVSLVSLSLYLITFPCLFQFIPFSPDVYHLYPSFYLISPYISLYFLIFSIYSFLSCCLTSLSFFLYLYLQTVRMRMNNRNV